MENIGERIKNIRNKKNFTLRFVGESLNVDYSHISKIERGDRTPSIELLENMAELFDVPLSYFFGESKPVPPDLAEKDVDWLVLGEEMEEKELSPDDIRDMIKFIEKLNKKS
jgi:transcriptional regulator with XRE-family HTH domain